MSRAASFALALLLALAGCSTLDPFPTAPEQPEPGGKPGARVAVCYNTLKTSLAEIRRDAQNQCPQTTVAEPVDTDWYLINCPLLLPARATFGCAAKK